MKIALGVFFGVAGLMAGVTGLIVVLPNTITGSSNPWILLPYGSALAILTSYYLLREEEK